MGGPVDPAQVKTAFKLPRARSFEQWRERVLARVFKRACAEADFDAAFEAIVEWMDKREIDCQQAEFSAIDIFVAMVGVCPGVVVQRCEFSGVIMLTMLVRAAADDKIQHRRTRTVGIVDLKAPTPLANIRQLKKKA